LNMDWFASWSWTDCLKAFLDFIPVSLKYFFRELWIC
jgi:hypothetical protein